MDDQSKELLVQAAVMGLQMVFTNLRLAGKSEEEISNLFTMEKAKFDSNHPDLLPDV